MSRLVPPVLALALFVGLGFVTRHYFPQWLESKIKEGDAAMEKERAKWKPVESNFSGVKFDTTKLVPTYQPSWQPGGTSNVKPVK
jgi:hypothetical protein